jgi:hypothetical protein
MKNIEWELENLDLNQKEKISLRGGLCGSGWDAGWYFGSKHSPA